MLRRDHEQPLGALAVVTRDHVTMLLHRKVQVDHEALASFARRHGIKRLALFGSVLRDDFNEHSDIDVLVEFLPDKIPGLLRLAAMELELESLLGRRAELRTYEDLSRHFRDAVREKAATVYDAA